MRPPMTFQPCAASVMIMANVRKLSVAFVVRTSGSNANAAPTSRIGQ